VVFRAVVFKLLVCVELRVMCPVCRMLLNNLKTTARNTTGSNHC